MVVKHHDDQVMVLVVVVAVNRRNTGLVVVKAKRALQLSVAAGDRSKA